MKYPKYKKQIEAALNDYFAADPDPLEARNFLLKIRQDIEIMLHKVEVTFREEIRRSQN